MVRDLRRDASAAPRIVPDELVHLEQHARDVQVRLEQILGVLGFAEAELPSRRLLHAALAHDAGKVHPRFQRLMGTGDEVLAKPRPGHRPDRGDGWRHEQLSAAFVAAQCAGDPVSVALVAAHHGHGRPLFTRQADELLDGWDGCAADVREWVAYLYGEGAGYEELRARAQGERGVPGLCWLEALSCCADRQVSAEGR